MHERETHWYSMDEGTQWMRPVKNRYTEKPMLITCVMELKQPPGGNIENIGMTQHMSGGLLSSFW